MNESQLQTYYLFEPVVAWRAWRIQYSYYPRPQWYEPLWKCLVSLNPCVYGYKEDWVEWKEKPMKAKCGRKLTFLERIRIKKQVKHEAPDPLCRCGFYGMKEIEPLLRELDFSLLRSQIRDMPLVIGRVEFWGKLIEHKLGYRAQFAWPEEVWILTWEDEPWAGLEIPFDIFQEFLLKRYKISAHLAEIYPPSDEAYWEKYNGKLPPVAARIGKIVGADISKP